MYSIPVISRKWKVAARSPPSDPAMKLVNAPGSARVSHRLGYYESTAAASELFEKHGVDEVTTQQIADAADIGTGTLFLYAKTKGELLLLVVEMRFQDLAELHERVGPQSGGLGMVQAVVQGDEGERARALLPGRCGQFDVLDVGVRDGLVREHFCKLGEICGAHAAPSEAVSVAAEGSVVSAGSVAVAALAAVDPGGAGKWRR